MKIPLQKQRGFTLLELLVASSLFIIIVTLASATFVRSLRSQREFIALTLAYANVTQAIEQIAREARTGYTFQGVGETGELNFTNYRDIAVSYKLLTRVYNGKAIKLIGRCDKTPVNICLDDTSEYDSPLDDYKYLTDPNVTITDLKFILRGTDEGDNEAPRITIVVKAVGPKDISIAFETSVAARIIDT